MRVAGHSYPYRDRPLGDALDELARLRLSVVEVWFGHAADGPDAVASALRERGLEAAAISAGGFYTPDSESRRGRSSLPRRSLRPSSSPASPRSCSTRSSNAFRRASRSAWRTTGISRSRRAPT
jgi:hypothetical protein